MSASAYDIISSGILDLYVAGALTSEETADVERMMATHPEVAAEVVQLQRTLEQFALLHTSKPRPELRSKVLQAVTDAQQKDVLRKVTDVPHSDVFQKSTVVKQQTAQQLPQQPRRWLLAASIAFLIGLMPSFYFYTQYTGAKSELTQTQVQLAEAKSSQAVMASKTSYMEGAMDKLADTNVMRVVMPGLPSSKSSFATVWWNRGTQEVMIDTRKMPDCPAGHDYQLWAIVDGKPVDLGVFNPENNAEQMLSMHAVGKPQLFAITIEPKGGSPSPTLDKMVVAGAVGKS